MPSGDVKNCLSPTCAEGTKLAMLPTGTLILNDQLYLEFADIYDIWMICFYLNNR